MGQILHFNPQRFESRLSHSDYSIYRDGFCLLIKNERSRQGYVLDGDRLSQMLMAFKCPVHGSFIEAVLVGDPAKTIWNVPTNEQIIQYCIDQAIIPHPYEEYTF